MASTAPPEHNITGQDFSDRRHLPYAGPIIDAHAHVMLARPPEPKEGEPVPEPGDPLAQAAAMLEVAAEFNVGLIYSMCPPEDIPPLRQRFGNRLAFIGSIVKKKADSADEEAYRLLDQFLEQGVTLLKFWSAPRGRERGLLVDAPWRIEAARRARAAGVRGVMVHVADPDRWFQTVYTDASKYGTKPDQYRGLERLLEMFPDLIWIGAHMGGDPEHPDHLEALLERYPHLYFDTSAAKWQIREVSPRREEIAALICRHPDRFLFGSDLVSRYGLPRDHYVSRYWSERTLWESRWEGISPIADPDYVAAEGGPSTPALRGLALPAEVLRKLYHDNSTRLLSAPSAH
jgi:predicted TIM-barrel fold metal-dependent hydrolase